MHLTYTMHKFIYTLLLLFINSICVSGQENISTSDRVELKIPTELKYQEKKNPAEPGVMINDDGSAKLVFFRDTIYLDDNDVPAFADEQLKIAMQENETFKYIDDGLLLQDGKNIGYIKFSTRVNGKKLFNYIFFTSVNERPFIYKFSCDYNRRNKWNKLVDIMANSLRVKASH